MITKEPILELCDEIRQVAFHLHEYLGHGHMEKVYENGLAHRLRKKGFLVEQQVPIKVLDEDGTILGEYIADLLISKQLIIEIKAVRTLCQEHIAQLLGYLKATHIKHGLLINFGSSTFQIRKFTN